MFNLDLVLLPIEVYLVTEEQSCKKDMLKAYGTNRIEIILALSTKIITPYMQGLIVQIGIRDLKRSIPEDGVCLAMFLALKKQF